MDHRINLFKDYWRRNYSYVEMALTDEEILEYLKRYEPSLSVAVNMAADYVISQGLGWVEE